jgi:iron(III) transport system substrate-binding protein
MKRHTFSRREVLKGSSALASAVVFASPLQAAAPNPTPVTPALIEAAKKEGKIVWYAAMDLPVAQQVAKAFEQKYPGISVHVERTGAERLFQRLEQERASNIFAADIVNSSDASHFITWKRQGWLEPFVPEEVAQYYPAEHRDPDGCYATSRFYFVSLAYNTSLVKREDAPKSFKDLLDPKWMNKLVKAHPSYSGTIMTSTFQMARDLGWDYFEKLAKQKVLQVQSAVDPPNKLVLGERAVMADGNDFNVIQHREAGKPVELVYPEEGAPLIAGPNAIFTGAPHPNAARLMNNYIFSREGQQFLCDYAAQHSAHSQVVEKPGRPRAAEIKAMKDDPAGVEVEAEEIKKRYAKYFGV